MTVLGEVALWVALFLALLGSAASLGAPALRRPELAASGARAIIASAPMTALAALGLWAALLRHDFSIEYVAAHTTMNTPTIYLVTAFWAGPAGATLGWAVALSICATVAVSSVRRRDREALPWVAGTLSTLLALTLATACFAANAYDRVEWVPAEGRGLAPHLQNTLAAPYFLATYAAYAAATMPLALALGATAAGPSSAPWRGAVRSWAALTWCLITVGIALRTRWEYVEPALGGVWASDLAHVTNAALWLVSGTLTGWLAREHRRASRHRGRGPRAVGVYVAYAGAAIVLVGLVARRFWTEEVIQVGAGEAREVTDPYGRRWRFISQGASRDERANYLSTGVAVEASRDGRNIGVVDAERRQHLDSMQRPVSEPTMHPGIRSSVDLDLYLLLAEVRGQAASLRVGFRPLVACLWVGCALAVAGTLVAAVQTLRARASPADRLSAVPA